MNIFAAAPTIDLGVNIDHVATLRNARGTLYPSPLKAALLAEECGADCITLHLREDRRHIRDDDVRAIREAITTRMNLEAAVTEEMLAFACSVRPHDVCLVPERRAEVTTEGGLDVLAHFDTVAQAVRKLHDRGIRVSLFIDADAEQIHAAQRTGATVVELHTGQYAEATVDEQQSQALARIAAGAQLAVGLGMKANAGHGLHYENVQPVAAIAEISELNIGHAIVAEAIFLGWEEAVRRMRALMQQARMPLRGASGPTEVA